MNMKQQSIQLSTLTQQQMKDLAGKWGEPAQKHLTVIAARCVDRVWQEEFNAMFQPGDFIYYINDAGEHIPGHVLAVRKRVKVSINDFGGDRVVWVSPSKLELQDD